MPAITISGMSCGHCTAAVTKALEAIDGVSEVTVDLEKKEAKYNATDSVSLEMIRTAISKIGFEVV